MRFTKKQEELIAKFVKKHNDNTPSLNLKITGANLKKYIKLKKVKDIANIDRKKIIDWITNGGFKELSESNKRNFEFFNYKIKISFSDKFLDNANTFEKELRFLCTIPKEKSDTEEYVYYKILDKHKTFFNTEILLADFLNLSFSNQANKRECFLKTIKPFIERYGYFISQPTKEIKMNSFWRTNDFVDRFKGEHRAFKKLIKTKRKYGDTKFSKNMKEPKPKLSDKYWEWYEDVGRMIHSIPTNRFSEYTVFRPIISHVLKSRKDRQAKFIGDFFPQPINILYKHLIGGNFNNWWTCKKCNIYFKKQRKDQTCCCIQHSKMVRDLKNKQKKG